MFITPIIGEILTQFILGTNDAIAVIASPDYHLRICQIVVNAGVQQRVVIASVGDIDKISLERVDIWMSFETEFDDAAIAVIRTTRFSSGCKPVIVSFLREVVKDTIFEQWANRFGLGKTGSIEDSRPASHGHGFKAYAVICTPRSGSTYLSELLASIGLGQPEEHIRHWEVDLLSSLDINTDDGIALLDECMRRVACNNICATKLISHFLFEIQSKWHVSDSIIRILLKRFAFVYLRRRDKAAQTVSDFLAKNTDMWHVRDSYDVAKIGSTHATIEYSFDEMFKIYDKLFTEEHKLSNWIKRTNYYTCYYEDIIDNPLREINSICKFLGYQFDAKPNAKVIRLESAINRIYKQKFVGDFKERFGVDPNIGLP